MNYKIIEHVSGFTLYYKGEKIAHSKYWHSILLSKTCHEARIEGALII
jgi:hypothetical protein